MPRKYTPYHKALLKLAFPLVLTQAGQTVVQLVDSAMVGRVGTDELAAASFAGSVYIILMIFGIGTTIAVTPLLGRAFGGRNHEEAAGLIKNSYGLYTLMTLFLFILTWAVSWFMPLMGQEKSVLSLAVPYYRLLSLSLIPTMAFFNLKQVSEGLGNTTTAMTATIISNISNIILNAFLIFGIGPFPALGLLGAGYATLISRMILPFLIYRGLTGLGTYQNLLPHIKSAPFTVRPMKELLKTGLPIAMQSLVEVFMFAMAGIMMGWIGPVPQAANQIAGTLTGLTFMTANGISQAVTIRLSLLRGRPVEEEIKNTVISAVIVVGGFMSLTGIMFLLLRYPLPRLFTPDPAVIEKAALLLIVGALFQFFDGMQCVGLGILRGFADVKVPMIAAVISYLIIGLPVGYLFAFTFKLGGIGIWYGFVAGLGFAGLFFFMRIASRWKKRLL